MKSYKPKFEFNTGPKLGKSLKIIPLGGVGDVTKNMFAYEYGDDIVIIDCGVSFPDSEMRGVDLVIPDINYLRDKKQKVKAILITHGHDDHYGALPYIWPELNVPIYSQRLTCGLIARKFEEHQLDKRAIKELKITDTLTLGVFKVSFYQVSHSVPDSTGIVLETPVGTIIHQSDFKVDWTPVNGQKTDVGRVAELGNKGVLLMAIDCLRSDRPGYTLSEKQIEPNFAKIEEKTKGKLFLTLITSNITRIQQALNVAIKAGRKVSLVGRSMENNFQVARELGYLHVPPGLIIAQEEIKRFASEKLMIIISGAFGQPGSALSRVANGEHKFVQLFKNDTVLVSADPMPSTEEAQGILIDNLSRFGCEVYYSASDPNLHVSVLPQTEVLIKDKEKNIRLQQIQDVDDEIEAYSFNRKFCTGSWQQAKKIKHHYKGSVYKITTVSGRSVEVTKGHSLFVLKDCQINEIKGEDLRLGDYLVIPKSLPGLEALQTINLRQLLPNIKGYSYKNGLLYYCGQCIGPAELRVDNNFARLLGYYLAEGRSAPRHLSIVLNTSETGLREEILDLIKNLLKCSKRTQTRANACEITFGTPFLGKVFKEWFGSNARVKKIPDFIFSTDEEAKLNFLGAYLNGDGGIDKGSKHSRIRVKTASKKLASDLLYLFSSVGITSRFDHIQNNPVRMVGKYELKKTTSYVIRVQGKEYINKLIPYLSKKFRDYFYDYYNKVERSLSAQTHSPEALPVREINILEEVKPIPNTILSVLYNQVKNKKSILSQNLINRQIILRDAQRIGNPLIYYMSGDLLFDPIKKIEISEYEGSVYDLSVPDTENFLGGFGGIFLHNSGHAAAEELKLMINLAKPKFLMPIGGGFKHIRAFSRMSQDLGYKENELITLTEVSPIELNQDRFRILPQIPSQNIYVDGLGVGDVGSIVLRDREHMSEEGIVVVVVPIDGSTGKFSGEPDLISRGFVFGDEANDLLDGAKEIVKSLFLDHHAGRLDIRYVRNEIENHLQRFFYEETKRRPLILTVIMED